MKLRRLAFVCAVFGVFAMASALSTYSKVFNQHYKVKSDSKLGKAACGVCHATAKGGKVNPYGVDLAKAMKAAKTKKLTPEILKKVEGLDSDKDGKKNIDEIKKDSNPGAK